MRWKLAIVLSGIVVLMCGLFAAAEDLRFDDNWWIEGNASVGNERLKLDVALQESFLGNVGVLASASLEGDFEAGVLSSGLDQVYISGAYTPYIVWYVGRRRLQWGPNSEHGLLLSGNAPSFDSLGYELRTLGTRYSRIYGRLDDNQRMLLAHRMELEPIPDLRLGVSEAAIVSGNFSPLLLNPIPLWPFFLSQHIANAQIENHEDRANVVLSFDARYDFSTGNMFWEYLADNHTDQKTSNSSKAAWRLGGTIHLIRDRSLSLEGEYAVVSAGAYEHNNSANNWLHRDEYLGFPLGSDVRLVDLSVRFQLDTETSVRWKWSRTQQGENTLLEQARLLNGMVQTSDRVGVQWTKQLNDILCTDIELFQEWRENANHKPGRTTGAGFTVDVGFRFGQ